MYNYIVYWTFVNPLNLQQICATPARDYEEANIIASLYKRQGIPVLISPIHSPTAWRS